MYVIEDIALANNFKKKFGVIDLLKYKDFRTIAYNLFEEFRKIDNPKYEFALVQKVEETGLGIAINDRIEKASIGNIIIINGNLRFRKK